MTINLSDSLVHLSTIKRMIDNREYGNVSEIVSDMALATQCHILVCLYYTMHFVGETEQLKNEADVVKKFYKIKEIKGWPLGLI